MSDLVPDEMTCVTASVADTTVYRISGVNADASTVSHRKPTASVSASVIGTPRTARLATASSHRISVRIVDAAKTTAYCRRNEVLVKSTSVVFVTAEDSLSIVHEAASAQPLAERGERVQRAGQPAGAAARAAAGLVVLARRSPWRSRTMQTARVAGAPAPRSGVASGWGRERLDGAGTVRTAVPRVTHGGGRGAAAASGHR